MKDESIKKAEDFKRNPEVPTEKKAVKKEKNFEQFPKGVFKKPFGIMNHREKTIKKLQ